MYGRGRGSVVLLLIGLILAVFQWMGMNMTVTAASSTKVAKKRVVVVSVPGLSFRELKDPLLQKLPHLNQLMKNGKIGALNVRTPVRGIEDSYLAIGAGAPAVAGVQSQGMHSYEKVNDSLASDAYIRYHGNAQRPDAIIVPNIAAIHALNETKPYGARIGLLGDSLQQHHIEVYVYGNRDLGARKEQSVDKMRRHAPLMMMNRHGVVNHGNVSAETLLTAVERPHGVKTNYSMLLQQWSKTVAPSFVLFELGDLDRLFHEQRMYDVKQFALLKIEILQEIDNFIGNLIIGQETGEVLWLFSPFVNSDATKAKAMLAPLINYEKGDEPQEGLLSSPTTRRSGIVAYMDLAPTWLQEFAVEVPDGMGGIPMQWKRGSTKSPLSLLEQELEHASKIYNLRPQLLYAFVTYEVTVLLMSLLFVMLNWRVVLRHMKIPLLSLMIAPSVMLAMGWIVAVSTSVLVGFFVAVLFALSWIANRLKLLTSMVWIGMVTAGLILCDALFGTYAMQHSVLGYDVMIGARYYGIGNEYMGVLIGAMVLGVSIWLQILSDPRLEYRKPDSKTKQHKIDSNQDLEYAHKTISKPVHNGFSKQVTSIVILLFIGVIVYMASPQLGTNAGGAITATLAFGVMGIRVYGGRILQGIHWGRILLLGIVLLAISFGGLWLLNAVIPIATGSGQPSHIGRAMQLLFTGDLQAIGKILTRKLEMNLHLIGVSSWSKVLIASLLVIVVMVLRPRGVFREWQLRYPHIMYGFSGNAVGAITALVFNDSGIVAAATMIIYVAAPILLLKLDNR